jgi:1,4-dihydroxy-2-naphthoyl-CoA hydrolase
MDLHEMVAAMPYAEALGITLQAAQPEEVQGSLEWTPGRCTTAGLLHGGVLMSLADSLGAICAFLNLPPGASTATIESKTNFFRGVPAGSVTATARPLHAGRRTIAIQTELRGDQGKLVAVTSQTQAVIEGSP